MTRKWAALGVVVAVLAMGCGTGPVEETPAPEASAPVASVERGPAPLLTAEEYGTVAVVIPVDAPELVQEAAAIFQNYWEKATGFRPDTAAAPEAGRFNVWIGWAGAPEDLLVEAGADALGADGIAIVGQEETGLLIGGENDRAVQYAVYEFFDRYLGVRWLAPGVVHVPETPPAALPVVNHVYAPPFAWREAFNWAGHSPEQVEYRRAQKLSNDAMAVAFGGHTLYNLMPPDEFFDDHPEFYSFFDGERRAYRGGKPEFGRMTAEDQRQVGQLCFTNEEMLEVLSERVLAIFRDDLGREVVSVSQEDWDGYCECEACSALDEQEGTPMGSLLHGVNYVAERVDEVFPGKQIHTFAYAYSVTPPKTIRPRENVIIQYCTIRADTSRAINDPDSLLNRRFAEELEQWTELTSNIHVWDYTPNFHNWVTPHPNFHTLIPTLRYFAECGVNSVFAQGCPHPQGEMLPLRSYMVARGLWDPSIDWEATMAEFIDLYFGPAAPYIAEYIDLMTETLRVSGLQMDCFDHAYWITTAMVEEARELFAKAEEATAGTVYAERVHIARVPVEYAAIIAAPVVTEEDGMLTLRRPDSMSLDEFVAWMHAIGMPQLGEVFTPEEFMEEYFDDALPARHATSPLVRLENDKHLLWLAPNFEGSVLRWQVKDRDVELLNGYRHYGGRRPGTWQDWLNRPFELEGPPARHYEVMEASDTETVIRATMQDGLTVERRITLLEDGETLEVALTLVNTTDEEVSANVKGHPEFYSQGLAAPEIHAWNGIEWEHLNADWGPYQQAHGEYLEVGDYTALAFRVPEDDLVLVNRFNPDELGGLLWFINVQSGIEQVNLELLPIVEPLGAGQRRTVTSTYEVLDALP